MENISDIASINDDDLFDLLDNIENQDKDMESEDSIYNYCEYCDTDKYIVNDTVGGIRVCENCGTVLQSLMDTSPEWKQFGDANASRCSLPINQYLPQSSLGTTIASKSSYCKVRDINNWLKMPYRERSLYLVFKYIQEKCERAKLYKCIIDEAKYLYKTINEAKHTEGVNAGKKRIIRGRNKKSLIAACVFYACKRRKEERSQKEIARIFDLRNTDITKGCKTFSILQETISMNSNFDYSTPKHFIKRHCNMLKLKSKYVQQAIHISKNIQKLKIATEHTPLSVAAGTVFLVTKINKISMTKKKIARQFEVSEVTITKVLDKLEKHKRIILNNKLTALVVLKMNNQKPIKKKKKRGVSHHQEY